MNAESSTPSVFARQLEGMGAESGFGEAEVVTPIRGTGLVSLLLGLISWVGMIGFGALVVPALAVIFGLISNRPVDERGAHWTILGKIGLGLGLLFGTAGYMIPALKQNMLGKEAMLCTQRYIDLCNSEYSELAIELAKTPANRFEKNISLRQFYQENEENAKIKESHFSDGGNAMIIEQGDHTKWELDRPVNVFHKYGTEKAEVVWKGKDSDELLQFFLQYRVDPGDVGQWHIEVVQRYRELIIAKPS